MRPSTPRRRLERLERRLLSKMGGAERAHYLVGRLQRKGPLTLMGLSWLQVLLPLDPAERCAYIDVIRQATAEDGIETPWSLEDAMSLAEKRLFVRQHICWRAIDGPHLVPWEAAAAYADYTEFCREQAELGIEIPALTEPTYTTLFVEMLPLDERARLRPPAAVAP